MSDMKYWDVNYITNVPIHGGGLLVQGETKEKGEEVARAAIQQRYPEDTIETLVIRPSKITRKQRREFERKYGTPNA